MKIKYKRRQRVPFDPKQTLMVLTSPICLVNDNGPDKNGVLFRYLAPTKGTLTNCYVYVDSLDGEKVELVLEVWPGGKSELRESVAMVVKLGTNEVDVELDLDASDVLLVRKGEVTTVKEAQTGDLGTIMVAFLYHLSDYKGPVREPVDGIE